MVIGKDAQRPRLPWEDSLVEPALRLVKENVCQGYLGTPVFIPVFPHILCFSCKITQFESLLFESLCLYFY